MGLYYINVSYAKFLRGAVNVSIRVGDLILHIMYRPSRTLSYAILIGSRDLLKLLNLEKWLGITLISYDIVFEREITLSELANGNIPRFRIEKYGMSKYFTMHITLRKLLEYAHDVLARAISRINKLRAEGRCSISDNGLQILTHLMHISSRLAEELRQTNF